MVNHSLEQVNSQLFLRTGQSSISEWLSIIAFRLVQQIKRRLTGFCQPCFVKVNSHPGETPGLSYDVHCGCFLHISHCGGGGGCRQRLELGKGFSPLLIVKYIFCPGPRYLGCVAHILSRYKFADFQHICCQIWTSRGRFSTVSAWLTEADLSQ